MKLKATKRILGIVGNYRGNSSEWDHTDEEFYGIGKVRSLSKFYETLGIDVLNRKMPRNLCEFVNSGEMHRTFYQGLRPDGMGIDYNKIDYKFQPIYENNKPKPNNLGK